MKKILVIGASILQLPAIIKAKEMGFKVAVVDYNSKAIAVPYVDEFYNVSTIDKEGVLKVAQNAKIDGIMTLATDMPMRTIAYVAEKMKLPGISEETALKATDKGEMIQAFRENDVACPWFFILSSKDELQNICSKLVYPCIIKPTDSSGSRGVALVQNEKELEKAYLYSKEASRNGKVIIEEYLIGSEVSVEIMVINGIPHILAITDKLTTGAPHFVETGHSQPSRLNKKAQTEISELAKNAVKAIKLENGPAHAEIMYTSSGPKMIEIGARMGGDNITTHLVPLSTGIDMVKATIDIAMGNVPNITKKWEKGSAIKYMVGSKGNISSISGVDEAKGIKGVTEIVLLKSVNDEIVNVCNSSDRIGYVIAQAEKVEDAMNICEKATNKIDIKIEL